MRPTLLVASDHAGFELKQALEKIVSECDWTDLGPTTANRVDYPDFAKILCDQVVAGAAAERRGVLICGSGIGMCISANKIDGIRAALVENPIAAILSREHNDANVLCLGARFLAPEYAAEIVRAWLHAKYDAAAGGGRHQERIRKIANLEKS